MAAVVGARSALPGYFTGAEARRDPVVVSFEKELGSFTASLGPRRKKRGPQAAEIRPQNLQKT